MADDVQIAVRVPRELANRLDEYAESHSEASRSSVVRDALRAALDGASLGFQPPVDGASAKFESALERLPECGALGRWHDALLSVHDTLDFSASICASALRGPVAHSTVIDVCRMVLERERFLTEKAERDEARAVAELERELSEAGGPSGYVPDTVGLDSPPPARPDLRLLRPEPSDE